MKKIIILFHLLIVAIIFSQKKFDVVYEADYKLNYKLSNANNYKKETTFALLINEKSSFFKDLHRYISDSLLVEKKLNTLEEAMKYNTDFRGYIGTTSAKLYVTDEINYAYFGYEEPNNINWKIKNEFKTIAGYKCQRAEATKYGRTWIAWFASEIPFQFGPYKFNGLPGLIAEVYDTKDDYHYTLYAFRKRKYTCKSANNATNVKNLTKEKVAEIFKNRLAGKLRLNEQFIENAEDREYMKQNAIKAEKNYNPIELSLY
ncbi:GLPGLI family protein [Chryseobacterium wanjuense]|jgi:GLPGLI family protein|uniref:GLPGLI family protein n=1 Tax=Chryseobacterium wanjuense TaxID=356305 RepID=A0A1I0S015_9FLAO|nr:GLPGLI family protein [Chryseobacterium wanjuense]SEW47466.1 GLPGLI family protein [Chryseobacterium wanjuense]